jgi:FkbM family methyltransferase
MKKTIYNLVSKSVKLFSKGDIIGKRISGLNKTLYYERSQHLTFLFQPTIKYEETLQSKIKEYIRKGDIIFDIGANIGQYAMPFSELVGKHGKVYSFEPDFKNFAFLQFNTNINKCYNVTCLNHGLGKLNSEMDFFRDTETGGRTGSFKKEFVGKNYKGFKENVVLKSFDTIIKLYGNPDFVKIDVEGFEEEVIEGLTIDLQNCKFLIEVRADTKNIIFEYFNRNGYECLWIDNSTKLINKADEIPGFANLIFKKPVANNV